ncbi:MAG: hypothetical protein ACFE7R_01360, partial [Candidatus Hodarchaeota archaeon]
MPIANIRNPNGAAIFAKSRKLMGSFSFSAIAIASIFAGAPIGKRNPPTLTAKIKAIGKGNAIYSEVDGNLYRYTTT